MIDFDPGSFKDPDGRVFRSGEHVFRTVTPAALARFEHLHNSGLIDSLVAPGLLMPTTIESAEAFGLDPARGRRSRDQAGGGAARLLQLRVDVLDAAGRSARHPRHSAGRARPRRRAEGRAGVQRPLRRHVPAPGGCVVARGLPAWSAVGRVHAVLPQLPCAAPRLGAHRDGRRAALARTPRRAAARRCRTAARVDTRAATGSRHAHPAAEPAGAGLRKAAGRCGEGRGGSRTPEGAPGQDGRPHPCARRVTAPPPIVGMGRVLRREYLQRGESRPEGRVRGDGR